MLFKGPGGFGRVVNIGMCVIMCIALSLIILMTLQGLPGNETVPIFTALGFGVSAVMSFSIGYVVGDLFPALVWGQKLCKALGIKNKIVTHIISSLILALILITLVSIACVWMTNIQSQGLEASIGIWTIVYPPLLGGGFLIILVTLPFVMKIASMISGFDPSKIQPPKAE